MSSVIENNDNTKPSSDSTTEAESKSKSITDSVAPNLIDNGSDSKDETGTTTEPKNNRKKGVLIHCREGMSRSPSIIVAYLIGWSTGKYTLQQAYELVKEKNDGILRINTGFQQQLMALEYQMYNTNSVDFFDKKTRRGEIKEVAQTIGARRRSKKKLAESEENTESNIDINDTTDDTKDNNNSQQEDQMEQPIIENKTETFSFKKKVVIETTLDDELDFLENESLPVDNNDKPKEVENKVANDNLIDSQKKEEKTNDIDEKKNNDEMDEETTVKKRKVEECEYPEEEENNKENKPTSNSESKDDVVGDDKKQKEPSVKRQRTKENKKQNNKKSPAKQPTTPSKTSKSKLSQENQKNTLLKYFNKGM